MKLPDFHFDASLNVLRIRMGIPADHFANLDVVIESGRLTPGELEKLISGQGIDITSNQLTILPDGTLAYKDSRVLVYIRDHHARNGEITPPRYHFFNCRTLKDMRDGGRFERYVVATEATGRFVINILEDRRKSSEQRKLNVCQNCLNETSFDGFTLRSPKDAREKYVAGFVPQQFFEQYPRSLIASAPRHTSTSAPINEYPQNWGEISRQARNDANWTCSICHLELRVHKKKYLHVHHRNGVRSDNTKANLQVLCLGCHAEEPAHHGMKLTPVYREFRSDTGWRPNRS